MIAIAGADKGPQSCPDTIPVRTSIQSKELDKAAAVGPLERWDPVLVGPNPFLVRGGKSAQESPPQPHSPSYGPGIKDT